MRWPLRVAVTLLLAPIASAAQRADAHNSAELLVRYAKWDAAAKAQAAVVPGDALLLARYRLNADDVDGAAAAIESAPPAVRDSTPAQWLAIEIALADGDLASAADLLERLDARAATESDTAAAAKLYCTNTPLAAPVIADYLRAQLALSSDDGERAIALLENVLKREPSFADATVLLANALDDAGRPDDALQRLGTLQSNSLHASANCPGILPDRIAYNSANILWETGKTAEAEKRYREAIAAAEQREQEFFNAVEEKPSRWRSMLSLLRSAERTANDAAPEARNNLGQLLLATATDELALVDAKRLFLAAAASPDYATPQFAQLGRARAEQRGGELESAVDALGTALWIDPGYRNALDLAASLTSEKQNDAAAAVLVTAANESLPRRFVESYYGTVLAAASDRARSAAPSPDSALFLASYEASRGNFSAARETLAKARAGDPDALWPRVLEAHVLGLQGAGKESIDAFREATAIAESRPLTMRDAIALRQSLGTFADEATAAGDLEQATRARTMLAALVGSDTEHIARAAPWMSIWTPVVITDATGARIPGATVTVTAKSQPPQTAITDTNGQARFFLRPGAYTLSAILEGFATRTETIRVPSSGVQIALGAPSLVDETITVAASANPEIVTLPGTPTHYEVFAALVDSRRLGDPAFAPAAIAGASSPESRYVMDDVQTNDFLVTAGGVQARSLALLTDAVLTAPGRPASDSDALVRLTTAPIRNGLDVVVGGFAEPEGLRSDVQPVTVPYERQNDRRRWSVDASAGGSIIRDRLWLQIFGNRDEESGDGGGPVPLASTRRRTEGLVRSRLLTWSDRNDTTATFDLIDDRRRGGLNDVAGAFFGSAGATSRSATRRVTTATLADFVALTAKVTMDAVASSVRDESTLRPLTAAGEEPQLRDPLRQLFAEGGVGFINDGRVLRRDALSARSIILIGGRHGAHEVRIGGFYEHESDALHDRLSGDVLLDRLPHGAEVARSWSAGGGGIDPDIRETVDSTPVAVFAQDSIELDPFVIAAGLRWTRQSIDFPGGAQLDTAVLQPRLTVTYAPEERWNVFAGYGRFADLLEADERAAFGSQRRFVVTDFVTYERFYGGLAAIDPHLRGRSEDEFTAGFSRSFSERLGVRVNAVRQQLRSDIHDFFCGEERYRCIGNPGLGIMETLQTMSGGIVDSPRARRVRDAASVALQGRHAARADFRWSAGYVWSRHTGNTEAPSVDETRIAGIDPYARPAFDFAELVPPDGPLADDRRHNARIDTTTTLATLPFAGKITIVAAAYWRSGAPRAAYRYSDLYGRYVFFESARGRRGRTPAIYDINTGGTYERAIGAATIEISSTIENLLNRQRATIEDPRLDFSEHVPIANPSFLQPLERTGARTIRLSARVRF